MQRPFLFLLACSLVAASPLHFPVFLDRPALRSIDFHHVAHSSSQYPERIPRSAELLFTASDDDEISHVWLPLGKRLHTNDHPVLPLHPASAKIVNVLGLSTRASAQSRQQQATCIIRTRADRLQDRAQLELEVAFQEGEGVVRLDEASSPYDLTGREVESYECF